MLRIIHLISLFFDNLRAYEKLKILKCLIYVANALARLKSPTVSRTLHGLEMRLRKMEIIEAQIGLLPYLSFPLKIKFTRAGHCSNDLTSEETWPDIKFGNGHSRSLSASTEVS